MKLESTPAAGFSYHAVVNCARGDGLGFRVRAAVPNVLCLAVLHAAAAMLLLI